MPLTGENRIIVKEGLKRIHHTKNIGMKALILQCGLEPENVESYHFGFGSFLLILLLSCLFVLIFPE